MTSVEEQGELEKARAEEILAAEPNFPGIRDVSVELDEDHTGDPAMWIVFHVAPGFQPDVPWIERFSPYATKMSLKLMHSGLRRFPYTRLKQTA